MAVRAAGVAEGEGRQVLGCAAAGFAIMASWYVLRPLRDALGLGEGAARLPALVLATLAATLVASAVVSALVGRLSRRRFLTILYHFFVANLLAFWLLFRSPAAAGWPFLGRAFFVWASVFNLLAVSLFWALMADLWRREQAARLFGLLSLGGSLGAVAGSAFAAHAASRLRPATTLLLAALLLELALAGMRGLAGAAPAPKTGAAGETPAPAERVAPGRLAALVRSPYLASVCGYVVLYTLTSTIVYLLQGHVVARAVLGTGPRAALFARIDLGVNLLTLLGQLFLTGRVLVRLGVATALVLLPVLTGGGLAWLALAPTVATLAVFQVLRRSTDYVFAKPARDVLFTVLPSADKYRAKSFIDTFLYRGGDGLGAWLFGLLAPRIGAPGLAVLAVPICAGWAVLGWSLGRRHLRAGEPRTEPRILES